MNTGVGNGDGDDGGCYPGLLKSGYKAAAFVQINKSNK